MSVVTISRGTFSGGKMLAECVSKHLGFRCIDRDVIVERAAVHGISQDELRDALEKPPTFMDRFRHTKYLYLTLIQAALAEEVRTGYVVYHGNAGHLLLNEEYSPGLPAASDRSEHKPHPAAVVCKASSHYIHGGGNMPDTRRILIVDDSNEQIVYYSEILEASGYEFMVAKDGREAMDIMKTNTPHLVLLDVMMPRKSGIAVFQQMKRDPNLEKIPIIIITGVSEVTGVDMKSGEERPKETYQDDMSREFGSMLREKLQSLTPDGFIEKPVEPAVLIAKIESLLGQRP